MNELKATLIIVAKEPSKIVFHESNDGISPKILISLTDKGEEK